jgi:hypothetical protein
VTDEARYVPTLPTGPVPVNRALLRGHFEAGGRPALWEALTRAVGSRAHSLDDVCALRAWVEVRAASCLPPAPLRVSPPSLLAVSAAARIAADPRTRLH